MIYYNCKNPGCRQVVEGRHDWCRICRRLSTSRKVTAPRGIHLSPREIEAFKRHTEVGDVGQLLDVHLPCLTDEERVVYDRKMRILFGWVYKGEEAAEKWATELAEEVE